MSITQKRESEAALNKPLSSTLQEAVEFIGGSNDMSMALDSGDQDDFLC